MEDHTRSTTMANRRERCSWCNAQLMVPQDAQTIICPVCQTITRFQPYDPLTRARETINNAASQFTGLISSVANMITTMAGSPNAYPVTHPYGGYGNYYAPPPRPAMPLPTIYGRKKALLCGVSYRGKSYKIKGSINDVNCMRFFLVERFKFPDESILMLTEDEVNPIRIPTRANMTMALKWLVQGCQAGDSLVFHFSGHGSKQRDYNNDEADGFNETICPLDFETEGSITDNEINATIVRPLPNGVTLHAIIDACYSETVLDLPYACRMNREGYYMWEDQRCSPYASYKGTSGGLAISFSACNDDQVCLDTTAFAGNTSTGALTYSFIHAVQNEPGVTYGNLLNAMRSAIRGAKTGGLRLNGPIASLVNKALFNTKMAQVPQLSSSEKFNIYSKIFAL